MDELLKQRKLCRDEIAATNKSLTSILANSELTAEQRTEHDKLDAKLTGLIERRKLIDRQIDNAQQQAADDEQQAKLDAEQKRQARQVRGGITSPDDPQLGTSVNLPNLIPVAGDPTFRGFKSPREFLLSVKDYGSTGKMDRRLEPLLAAGSDEARGNSDPAGGVFVPEGFSPDWLRIKPEADPMGQYITKIPMALPNLKIPARVDTSHATSVSGGLTVTRKPETVPGTASQQTLARINLIAHTLFGLSYATEELLTDSAISFVAILEAGFSDQFTYAIIKERLNGTGNGEFLGVLNAANPALISVTKETGQAAATITYKNVLDMASRVWGYQKSLWMVNHDCLPQLGLLNQAVGTAGAGMIWMPSAREDTPNLLLGRPVVFSEYMQTLGTAGDIACINWSEYIEGIYQPMQSAESMHVRFVNHERAFKFWLRNAGMPWWLSALTPASGSTNTLSPYVTVATRA